MGFCVAVSSCRYLMSSVTIIKSCFPADWRAYQQPTRASSAVQQHLFYGQLNQQYRHHQSTRQKETPAARAGWRQKGLTQMGAADIHQVWWLFFCKSGITEDSFVYWICLLQRCLGLDVKDFGPSWRTGLAFFAVINALRPNLVDMERARRRPNRENLQEAFLLAETELGVPQLLDPEGMIHYCIS